MTLHLRTTSVPNEPVDVLVQKKIKKSAFPAQYDHDGWLDIRTRATKPWKRKYFVLANNFLLMAVTPYSQALERVIPLEGSNVKSTTKVSSMAFEILVRRKRFQFRAANEAACNVWADKIERASRLRIKDVYRFHKILGANASGSTKVIAAKHRITGEEVAVKVISKKEYDPKMLSNEVLILKRLSHPHVVRLFDLFETKNSVYLVMEKCNGGELFEQIAALDGGGFSEKQCINVLHQIAKAVKYMHGMGIVHRDLKPENILCTKPNSIQAIKIADFGISKVIFDPNKIRTQKEENSIHNMRNADIAQLNLKRQQKQKEKQQLLLQQQMMSQSSGGGSSAGSSTNNNSNHNNNNSNNFSNNRNNFRRTNSRNRSKKRHKKGFKHPLKKNKFKGKKHRMSSNNMMQSRKYFEQMTTVCGTISYTAPEILKERPYDNKVDYWSLGVIAYILLCGYPPFYGDTEYEVAQSILNSEVILEPEDWGHVSVGGKKLVLGLLNKNPRKRLTADDILNHTWLFASKETSTRARTSLMRTIAKRRIRKMSMGAFEMSSKRMNYIYKRAQDDNETYLNVGRNRSNSNSLSDSSGGGGGGYSSGSTNSNSRFSNMMNDRRISRTDEDLFELRLPSINITPRASFIADDDDDDDDDDGYARM